MDNPDSNDMDREFFLRSVDSFTLWHPFSQMLAYARETAPIIERGEGVYLIDTAGNRYFDAVSSLWCNVHGHRHPVIDQYVRDQLDRISHSTLLGLGSVPSIELADELTRRSGMEHIFYADSGSAAVEIALKLAFQFWKLRGKSEKSGFIAFKNSYHGDTLGSVSVGGIEVFHSIFGPLLFDASFVPTPFPYRSESEDCLGESLAALEAMLKKDAGKTAAVVIEPLVQGAAGMIVHPEGFLKEVRRLSREYDVLMIADEVATGFGRTGTMFACEQEDVRPDFLTLGKGITGGYLPLSAVLTTGEVFSSFLGNHEEFRHFFHGHTYTGNALACAAALGSLKVFDDEDVLASLSAKEQLVRDKLAVIADHPHVGDVRQKGLMIGIELVEDKATKKSFPPEKRMGHQVTLEARKRGMITRPLSDVLIFMPPLASTPEELTAMTKILIESINATEY